MSLVNGLVVNLPQEEGPAIDLALFGDEFYARYETPPRSAWPGYTALRDAAHGRFCYAQAESGRFTSTGVPLDQSPPEGLPRRLRECAEVRVGRSGRAAGRAIPADEVYGPNKGLLAGRTLSSGAVTGLTVIVEFQDLQAAIAPDEVAALLNAPGYRRYGNSCSVRDYFGALSAGKLDFNNVVVGPLRLRGRRREYIDTLPAAEALEMVAESGIDLHQFDSRGEGFLDAVTFLYAGETLYEGLLWPHCHTLDWRDPAGSQQTSFYQISSLGQAPAHLQIGAFCHEAGHMLCRFPDLYDYGRRDADDGMSAGLGVYCLMSSGNHLGQGKSPSPVCAYLRRLAGWVEREIPLNKPGTYTLHHGDYAAGHIFHSPRDNEYFLLENRSRLGLDHGLASSGLAVLHCDTLGSNEWQANSADRHYQCLLLQADALAALERNENSGDEGDLFRRRAGKALHADSVPGTRWWDGSDSGLRIRDISDDGEEMTFTVY